MIDVGRGYRYGTPSFFAKINDQIYFLIPVNPR